MQKKQGNFRVFCNDALPPSRCGQASATRRRQLRRCAPACPLAEKNFATACGSGIAQVQMRKSAQTFLRRAATSTRAMRRVPRRRDATHRTTAARPAHTSPTHRHACDCPRPLPLVLPPMPSHGCVDRRGSHRSPADAGTHRAVAHRRRAKRAPRRHCPRRYPTSRPACRAASAPRRKTGTDRSVDRMHQLPTARSNALPSRCCPATTSHRLRSDARGDAGDAGSGIAMQRMAPPTRGRWRPHRAAPKRNRPHWAAGSGVATGSRLSGRLPRAVRRTRPATAVRSTARHRPLPAPGSSLRRRRLR